MILNLEISLFGHVEIRLGGQLIPHFKTAKVKALLAYLAVEAAQPQSRETLAALLWPEQSESTARVNLRKTLQRLRLVIPAAYLHSSRQTVQFNPDSEYGLDVTSFAHLVSACRDHQHLDPITCQLCLTRWHEAVPLYQNDFLAHFFLADSSTFEEWALLKREWLRRELLHSLYQLAAHHEQEQRYDLAYRYAWRQIEVDPLREEAYRQLMLIYARTGHRSAALAQYQACADLLKAELGASPTAETVALYRKILGGTMRQATPTAAMASDLPSFLSDDHQPAFEKPPVVAREYELGRLHSELELALTGQGRLIFVTGEAGRGKTVLMDKFSRQAQKKQPDLLVAVGNGEAFSGSGDPYLPFRDILAMLTGDVEAKANAGTISRDHARRLWRQTPQTIRTILDRGPDLFEAFVSLTLLTRRAKSVTPGGADWLAELDKTAAQRLERRTFIDVDQTNLFQQYATVLQAVSQNHPLLLVLDDLQWADTGSIDLLFYLGRQLVGSRILIVGAYRQADVDAGRRADRHPLAPILNEFQRRFGRNQLDLRQADNRLLIEAMLDSEPNRLGPSFRETLYRHTRGHALFTVESLRAMQARQELVKDDAGYWIEGSPIEWSRLPARVEAVIGERLDRLPAKLQEILQVASIMGEEFTAEVVARVLQVEAWQIIRQLSGVLDRQHHLVRSLRSQNVNGQELSHYQFRHNLFQDYLYQKLDNAERVYWHQAVALVMEQFYADETTQVAVQLARHFEAAGLIRQALGYLQQAGEHALAVSAYIEARTHFEKALDLLDSTTEAETAALAARLRLKLGEILYHLSDFPTAQAVLEIGLADARRHNDLLLVAEILYSLSRVAEESETHGNFQQIQSTLEESLLLAQYIEDETLLARVLYGLGSLQYKRGNYEQAKRFCEESLALAEQSGDIIQQLFTLHRLGSIAYSQHDPDKVEQLAKKGLTKARQIGHREREGIFLSELAIAAWQRGNYDSARVLYQQALTILRQAGKQGMVAWLLTNLADIAARQADPAAARRYLHEALKMFQSISININKGLGVVYLYGWLLAKDGAIEQGLALVGSCIYHPGLMDTYKWEIYNIYLPDLGLDPQDPAIAAQLEAGKNLDFDKVVEELLVELEENRR